MDHGGPNQEEPNKDLIEKKRGSGGKSNGKRILGCGSSPVLMNKTDGSRMH